MKKRRLEQAHKHNTPVPNHHPYTRIKDGVADFFIGFLVASILVLIIASLLKEPLYKLLYRAL